MLSDVRGFLFSLLCCLPLAGCSEAQEEPAQKSPANGGSEAVATEQYKEDREPQDRVDHHDDKGHHGHKGHKGHRGHRGHHGHPCPGVCPSLEGVGWGIGGNPESAATDVSADGKVVTGASYNGTVLAFRRGETLEILEIPGAEITVGEAISGDGSVIAGFVVDDESSQALIWKNGEIELLDFLPGGVNSAVGDISENGKVVVGSVSVGGHTEAFRWDAKRGMEGLGIAGATGSQAMGVSHNGAVIAGVLFESLDGMKHEAFRWRRNTGIVPLGAPEGFEGSQALGIGPDGKVIVGAVLDASTSYPALWTRKGGWLQLSTAAGIATTADQDGSMVVGSLFEGLEATAFVWDEEHGVRELEDILTEAGVSLGGWSLYAASGVSNDGKIVVGSGVNPQGLSEGFIACLP